jgi:hypothetical protein
MNIDRLFEGQPMARLSRLDVAHSGPRYVSGPLER